MLNWVFGDHFWSNINEVRSSWMTSKIDRIRVLASLDIHTVETSESTKAYRQLFEDFSTDVETIADHGIPDLHQQQIDEELFWYKDDFWTKVYKAVFPFRLEDYLITYNPDFVTLFYLAKKALVRKASMSLINRGNTTTINSLIHRYSIVLQHRLRNIYLMINQKHGEYTSTFDETSDYYIFMYTLYPAGPSDYQTELLIESVKLAAEVGTETYNDYVKIANFRYAITSGFDGDDFDMAALETTAVEFDVQDDNLIFLGDRYIERVFDTQWETLDLRSDFRKARIAYRKRLWQEEAKKDPYTDFISADHLKTYGSTLIKQHRSIINQIEFLHFDDKIIWHQFFDFFQRFSSRKLQITIGGFDTKYNEIIIALSLILAKAVKNNKSYLSQHIEPYIAMFVYGLLTKDTITIAEALQRIIRDMNHWDVPAVMDIYAQFIQRCYPLLTKYTNIAGIKFIFTGKFGRALDTRSTTRRVLLGNISTSNLKLRLSQTYSQVVYRIGAVGCFLSVYYEI